MRMLLNFDPLRTIFIVLRCRLLVLVPVLVGMVLKVIFDEFGEEGERWHR